MHYLGTKLSHQTPIKFKRQYKALSYYSMPASILFAAKKRLNFVFMLLISFCILLWL